MNPKIRKNINSLKFSETKSDAKEYESKNKKKQQVLKFSNEKEESVLNKLR